MRTSTRWANTNTTTGAAINPDFITGLDTPTGLALSGNNLFVANEGNGTVGEYNATTGAAINPDFISGSLPTSTDSRCRAITSSWGAARRTVGEYNANTGAAINPTSSRGCPNPTDSPCSAIPSCDERSPLARLANTTPIREQRLTRLHHGATTHWRSRCGVIASSWRTLYPPSTELANTTPPQEP